MKIKFKHFNFQQIIQVLMVEYIQLKSRYDARSRYKLIGWEKKTSGIKLNILVCGTTRDFYSTPEEILADNDLLDGFIGHEVKTIAFLSKLTNEQCARYRLVSQQLDTKINQIIYILHDSERGEKFSISLPDLQKNSAIKKQMNGEDGEIIGFASAMLLESKTPNDRT